MPLTAADIKVGRVFSAKRPKVVGLFCGYLNDRQVIWVGSLGTEVQYDSPTVANGRHYPKISMEKFLAWANEDVTSQMPNSDWRRGN